MILNTSIFNYLRYAQNRITIDVYLELMQPVSYCLVSLNKNVVWFVGNFTEIDYKPVDSGTQQCESPVVCELIGCYWCKYQG